jgi:DNA-directed RNA polymerase subunit RPC12/RpoP
VRRDGHGALTVHARFSCLSVIDADVRLPRRPIGDADLRSDPALREGMRMNPSEPKQRQLAQLYRPLCSRCGALSMLIRVEPSAEPDHDLRTFECPSCGHVDPIKMKFR